MACVCLTVPMLNLFGLVAVTATLVFYALEDRSPACVLTFAGGCAASSVYGFLQGGWPFGLVEIAWTIGAALSLVLTGWFWDEESNLSKLVQGQPAYH